MDQPDAVTSSMLEQNEKDDHNSSMLDQNEEDTKSSSVTSQDEALMELLGLDSYELPLEEVGESSSEEEEESSTPPHPQQQQQQQQQHHILLQLPPNNHRHGHPPEDCWAYQFPDMVSLEECQNLIQLASNGSFQYVTKALHTTPDGGDKNKKNKLEVELDHPNHHKLSVFHHPVWVETLWKRIQHRLQLQLEEDKDVQQHNHNHNYLITSFLDRERRTNPSFPPPTALNPRLRILKYDANDQDDFAPHYDATTRSSNGNSISLVTVLLYLNTGDGHDFEGGETYFLNAVHPDQSPTKIIPQAGTMVIFEHDLYHSGHPLLWGTKYVLRTDLLFEISEDEWAQSAARQNDDDQKQQHPPTPTTMVELVALEWKEQSNRDLILHALDQLGMRDASIESFCAPGRFALLLMLQDVMTSCCLEEETSQRLVERAFGYLSSRSKK